MAPQANQQPPSSLRIGLTIFVALVESLLFSGVSYGIPLLLPMLERRSVYRHLCTNATDTSVGCEQLKDQVTLAFTIAQVATPFGNLASGFVLDRFGFRTMKAATVALFGLGSLCLTLVQPGLDWLIFPGAMMLGASGIQVMVSNLQLAPMVRYPFIIASLISGLFDASTMVFSLLNYIITKEGVNSSVALGTYSCFGVATIALTIFIYPGKYSMLTVELETQEQPKALELELPHADKGEVPIPAQTESHHPTLLQQLLSTDFILMEVWMVCNYLRLNYSFGSINHYTQIIAEDKAQADYYASIFGYFFLSSPLLSLLPGALLDLQKRLVPSLRQNTLRVYKLNTVSTLTLTGLFAALSCLMLLANTTGMLVPVYIVLAVHRSFMFSTLGNYCISVFSPRHLGIIYTSIFCIAAPFVLITFPLTTWLKDSANPDPMNFILTALSFVSLVHPAVLLLRNLGGPKQRRHQVQPAGASEAEFQTEP